MSLEPWYRVVTARKEVREGRSFNPDEFAIHLEQVVAGTAPEDYRDPAAFFARTCFTRALTEHTGMALRRLAGRTDNTAPVLTLVTQFGGGKTHTLAALYHLAKNGPAASSFPGVSGLLSAAGLPAVPEARVGVFVGSAWDPRPGHETPWIDLARQLAGDADVEALGPAARTSPPGTEALAQVFEAAGGCVLLLFDEVLNALNRHRSLAEPFHAFIQNLTVATTGNTRAAAVISLPRSQVEMTDWDLQWQGRITKVVRRVAKDLIANDEAEIAEVVRRRLFENLGPERTRKKVARAFADWCFERRAQLPAEWTAVDTAKTENKAREYLQSRFEDCFPFHPATLSVFQRKWQSLPQYQQTRGTLAMLAQWISKAGEEGFRRARTEPLITLGSAPLDVSDFRSVVLAQLGESRLSAALTADVSGDHSHAAALDADSKGALRGIHRRVATAIMFESSGGQANKSAHLPELRFALGEPGMDTTSIDNAAFALEARAYYIRRVGAEGFRIMHKPTLKKVVSDRRASLDPEKEVKPKLREVVHKLFNKGATIPLVEFPADGAEVEDTPRLKLIVVDPEVEWSGSAAQRQQVGEWTRRRGESDRLYPASLVWCFRKPGRDLRDKVETWLSWKRVAEEEARGELGGEFDRAEREQIRGRVMETNIEAEDEVWADYRFIVLADRDEPDGLQVIDLGAGHSSGNETLCGRVLTALKAQGLLNEAVGAGYLDRNWPPALKESGAWPLTGLRQSFLNGTLTRLPDPDATLRRKIVEFVEKGDLGLASGENPNGTYQRVWFGEPVSPEEVDFAPGVFLLTRAKAEALKKQPEPPGDEDEGPGGGGVPETTVTVSGKEEEEEKPVEEKAAPPVRLRVVGTLPPEQWNRLGTKLLPKLRTGEDMSIKVEFSTTLQPQFAGGLEAELRQILADLGLEGQVRVEKA
jgi:hypothetical protein